MKESAEVDSRTDVQTREGLRTAVGFGIPFLLITYLAFASGGYELVPRSEIGIVAWWAVLLGVLAGILPLYRPTRATLLILAVIGGLLLWTACGLLWTDSTERTIIELTRVATLLGIVLLLVLTQDRDGFRNAVIAVAASVVLVTVVALTDRLLPNLLPFGSDYVLPQGYPRARLNYPLEYWNGLATFIAIGAGPLLWLVTMARSTAVRGLAAGFVPVLALAGYLTASRGGVIEIVAVIAMIFVLFPGRIRLLLNLIVPALGSIALILLVNQRQAVRDLDSGQLRLDQGEQMAWLLLAVFVIVTAAHIVALKISESQGLRIPRPSRKAAGYAGIAAGLVVLVFLIGSLVSGFAGEKWDSFKKPSESGTVERLSNVNSGERYLIWKSAVEASQSDKLLGIGPGAFEFWWARDGQGTQFVKDAHSIYLENLAELGPVALVLVLALILGPIFLAVVLSLRREDDGYRALLAACAAGMVAFAVAAGIDWVWELTVLPVAFFVLAVAVAASTRENPEPVVTGWGTRIPVALGSVVAIFVIAVPMSSRILFDESQSAVRNGDLELALEKADSSSSVAPWSTSALIQRAQVLQLMGRDREAADLAVEATEKEPVNWTNWLVLSQMTEQISAEESSRAFEEARSLNPKSPLFVTQ
jgi:hypothetical protein